MNDQRKDKAGLAASAGESGLWRVDAAGAADGAGRCFGPASLLVEGGAWPAWRCRLVALGEPGEVDRHPAAGSVWAGRRIAMRDAVVLPGMVNAHAHLDLTHVGPRGYDPAGGFVGWAMSLVRPNRAATIEAAMASLREGVARSLEGGVVAVGDVIGAVPGSDPDARVVLCRELERVFGAGFGVGFGEVFGVGATERFAVEQMRRLTEAGCAVQPHAPYSAGPGVYREAARLAGAAGGRWCTHLAETLDERRFVERGDGAFRDLLERLGMWDDAAARAVGLGQHPIEHVLGAIQQNPGLEGGACSGAGCPPAARSPARSGLCAAHVNDCPERLIPALAEAGVSVAYCPRGHAYFGHPGTTGPHRYRAMLEAGVNVCLGTDSVINLPSEQAGRISVLDEMRLLVRRDGVPPAVALAMGTINGARALGMEESAFTLAAGSVKAGLVAVRVEGGEGDPLDRVMRSSAAPVLLTWADGRPDDARQGRFRAGLFEEQREPRGGPAGSPGVTA